MNAYIPHAVPWREKVFLEPSNKLSVDNLCGEVLSLVHSLCSQIKIIGRWQKCQAPFFLGMRSVRSARKRKHSLFLSFYASLEAPD